MNAPLLLLKAYIMWEISNIGNIYSESSSNEIKLGRMKPIIYTVLTIVVSDHNY